jgi:hypothetical protein
VAREDACCCCTYISEEGGSHCLTSTKVSLGDRFTRWCALQTVLENLQQILKGMEFSKNALQDFPHSASSNSILELILRDVPLQTPEIEICEALSTWASAQNDEDDDPEAHDRVDPDSDELQGSTYPPLRSSGPTTPGDAIPPGAADSRLSYEEEKLLDVPSTILEQINLNFISTQDLCYVRFLSFPCF